MPIRIGLDTSFVLGLIDDHDLWHSQAQALQILIDTDDFQTFAFDCVLTEAISTLARRTHEKRRTAQVSTLLARLKAEFPTKSIVWLYPDLPHLYDDVVALVEQTDGEMNFNDALIALSCRNRNIPFLASFDADFDRVDWLKRVARPTDLD
jgi:predicted nucleic acid-binding protein